jgi:REP element-mobilizing transposase RayT
MGSTFYSLHYHVTFSTKLRRPIIQAEWSPRLHKYLGGIILGLDGQPCGIGGVADHVHILMGLKTTHCLADVMRELKKSATAWVHDELKIADFSWQEGYAAFTVSPSVVPQVQGYIAHQEEHHRKRSYREELKGLLDAAGIPYEDKYLD